MKRAAQFDVEAWWQLLRVANVFTAISNVVAGFLLVHGQGGPLGPLLLVAFASALLYEAGMILNDVCDAELDKKERPERPIPSGRISRKTARNIGIALLVAGVALAHLASVLTEQWQTAQVSIALAAAIVGYNAGLKSTRFGPLTMAGCRMLNVLLGASIAGTLSTGITAIWLFAWGTFFHTYGLTRIARQEADSFDHVDLWVGCVAVLVVPLWLVGLPFALDEPHMGPLAWLAFCLVLLGYELWLARRLIASVTPHVVRRTVGILITLFIVIDAGVSSLAAGWLWGLVVLALVVPTRLLARRIAMT